MNSVTKMTVVPFNEQDVPTKKMNSTPRNAIMARAALTFANALKIFSKVALLNGYNEVGNIQGIDGTYISNTDIAQLVQHALSPGKVINGENEFVSLLRKAKISPSLIINENIKQRLMKQNIPTEYPNVKTVIHLSTPVDVVRKPYTLIPDFTSLKIKNFEEEDEVPKAKRIKNWEFSDDDD